MNAWLPEPVGLHPSEKAFRAERPDQIDRYLDHLAEFTGYPRRPGKRWLPQEVVEFRRYLRACLTPDTRQKPSR